ncbi:MAG: carboxypeptidase regulatory-like domain-containing protein, partial [Acidobacteria bacterium]|nr:carboxypeptidase regulatory-like domain-containing protein [Acidobacteriota bacterium]
MRPFGKVALCLAVVAAVMLGLSDRLNAQGVTTGAIAGIVTDAQGAVVPGASVTALHVPSGTTYETVTQADGRFSMPGMRVGGPYRVSASLSGFETQTKDNINVSLGVATDLEFTLRVAGVTETVTVTGVADPIFSSSRTGAATAISRETLATLPSVSQRLQDITRLTPQASGLSFVGQDSRFNNVTVDGSYFNNSFGLGNTPGDRTGVAPISLDAIEQIQVSIAPFDVRQGNFVGAAV